MSDPVQPSVTSFHLHSIAQWKQRCCGHAEWLVHCLNLTWNPRSECNIILFKHSNLETARQHVIRYIRKQFTLTRESLLPDAMMPCCGCQSADFTSPPCPVSTRSAVQVAKSHTCQAEIIFLVRDGFAKMRVNYYSHSTTSANVLKARLRTFTVLSLEQVANLRSEGASVTAHAPS